jgi:hypothetical protein
MMPTSDTRRELLGPPYIRFERAADEAYPEHDEQGARLRPSHLLHEAQDLEEQEPPEDEPERAADLLPEGVLQPTYRDSTSPVSGRKISEYRVASTGRARVQERHGPWTRYVPRGGVYDSGTAPICFIAPSRSYSGHSSTILPLSSKRSIWMPLISMRLPEGATPKNSP